MFKVVINEKMVTEWNPEYQDWSGDERYYDVSLELPLNSLDHNSIAKTLRDVAPYVTAQDVEDGLLDSYNQYISVVENADGYPDENGKYLCNYYYDIYKVEHVDIYPY